MLKIEAPYLLFLGDVESNTFAKTAHGLAHWRPELCLGQLKLEGCKADVGLPNMSPAEAAAKGAKTLVVGVAPVGGRIQESWLALFREALEAGLDITAGLHDHLIDIPDLHALADSNGRKLIDVRIPPPGLPVGEGRKRTGFRLLTVGTDCAIGKKWAALSLAQEMQARGMDATFRATGQTGIMIAGEGVPIDAVVADFIAGAAEILSPDADPAHWDVIEGQGSLSHPGYAAVSLGLLHGSQPDAVVVCHEPSRTRIKGYPGYSVASVEECLDLTIRNGRLTNPNIRCVGMALITQGMSDDEARHIINQTSDRFAVPCVDPLRDGVGAIVDFVQIEFGKGSA